MRMRKIAFATMLGAATLIGAQGAMAQRAERDWLPNFYPPKCKRSELLAGYPPQGRFAPKQAGTDYSNISAAPFGLASLRIIVWQKN